MIQDEKLKQPISLAGSTMRGVHGCHKKYMVNMGSIASLVMAVVINDNDEEEASAGNAAAGQTKGRKLWGLIVCHHSTPRHVAFPLRSACEFLMQVRALPPSFSAPPALPLPLPRAGVCPCRTLQAVHACSATCMSCAAPKVHSASAFSQGIPATPRARCAFALLLWRLQVWYCFSCICGAVHRCLGSN